MSADKTTHFHHPGLKIADETSSRPVTTTNGNEKTITIPAPSNGGGFLSKCKNFFTNIFKRKDRTTLSAIPVGETRTGVIVASDGNKKSGIIKKIFKNNGRKRRPGRKNAPGRSIEIGAIGSPGRKVAQSEAPPSEGLAEEIDLQRRDTTYIPGYAYPSMMGTHSFVGTPSFAGTPSMMVESNIFPSMNEELNRGESSSVAPKNNKAEQLRNLLENSKKDAATEAYTAEQEKSDYSPPPKLAKEDSDNVLKRFSLASGGNNSLRISSNEKESYLGDIDDKDVLHPVVRKPGIANLKRQRSKQKSERLVIPPKSPIVDSKTRQARSADAVSYGYTPNMVPEVSSRRALSAETFSTKDDMKPVSANSMLTDMTPSEMATRASPETMLHVGSSTYMKTKERNAAQSTSMFSSFRTKKRKKKKKGRRREDSGGSETLQLVSEQFANKNVRAKGYTMARKKKIRRKHNLEKLEKGYVTPDTAEL